MLIQMSQVTKTCDMGEAYVRAVDGADLDIHHRQLSSYT